MKYLLFTDGYSIIAVNTVVNCSTLGVGTSNRKKRKLAECNNEKEEDNEWIPVPKNKNVCILFKHR